MPDTYLGLQAAFIRALSQTKGDKIKKKNEECSVVCCAYHIEKQGYHCKKSVRLAASNLGPMKKVDIESRCTLWLIFCIVKILKITFVSKIISS